MAERVVTRDREKKSQVGGICDPTRKENTEPESQNVESQTTIPVYQESKNIESTPIRSPLSSVRQIMQGMGHN